MASWLVRIREASNCQGSSWRGSRAWNHIPTQDFADGHNDRERYINELKELLESDYRKYNKAGLAFKVPIPIGRYSVKYRVVLPKDRLEEMKHLPNNVFNWALASAVTFAQNYTGAPHHPEWIRQTIDFSVNRYKSVDDVRAWLPIIATFVAPLIPSVRRLRQSRLYVKRQLTPMYQHLKSRNMLGPDEKAKLREQSYGFQWLWGGVPENVTLEDFSDTIMRTLIALIHTTAKTMSIALMDILSQHKHLDELRQEALDAQRSDGSINIDAPFKLDCFLKESQRLTPVFLCKSPNLHCTLEVIVYHTNRNPMTMNRIVTRPYTFHTPGLSLPVGS
ncbi:hypothetical protein LTR98_010998 [Exophiala xenobiotica]|nr:hypothetical protein LTR98_010998 [Exophiala xenobiotica]